MLTDPIVPFTQRVREALERGLPLPLISGAEDPPKDPPPDPPKNDDPPKDPPPADPPKNDDPPDPSLGDAGKRALAAEREARATAEKRAKDLEKELAEIRKSQMSDQEKAVAEAEARGRDAARAEGNDRIIRSEVRAVAAGKLADPADAVRFLDLTKFKVDDEGNVDGKAIEAAIAKLVEDKPYLVGDAKPRPSGSGDGGARGDTTKQLTREDLKTMTPEQIEEARVAGRLTTLLGAKT